MCAWPRCILVLERTHCVGCKLRQLQPACNFSTHRPHHQTSADHETDMQHVHGMLPLVAKIHLVHERRPEQALAQARSSPGPATPIGWASASCNCGCCCGGGLESRGGVEEQAAHPAHVRRSCSNRRRRRYARGWLREGPLEDALAKRPAVKTLSLLTHATTPRAESRVRPVTTGLCSSSSF